MKEPVFQYARCAPSPERPKIGLLCSYTPEEVILAAGLQPFRLHTSGKPLKRADAYLHNTLCAYVRSVLDAALEGEAAHLAGMVFVNSCDAMRRLCDVWRHYVRTDFVYILDLPREASAKKVSFYALRLQELAEALEGSFQCRISKETLSHAIQEVNRTRRLFSELAGLVRSPTSSLGMDQLLPLYLASQSLDREQFNRELEDYVSRVRELHQPQAIPRRTRVLLTGSVIDQPEIVELMGELGFQVAAADICTAQRGFEELVEEQGDPWMSLARRYLLRAPCARMKGLEKRLDFIRQLIADYQVAGVISYTLKFCDPELMFYPLLKQELEKAGVPHVHIEGDGTLGSFGQMKTRLQAFAEMLKE